VGQRRHRARDGGAAVTKIWRAIDDLLRPPLVMYLLTYIAILSVDAAMASAGTSLASQRVAYLIGEFVLLCMIHHWGRIVGARTAIESHFRMRDTEHDRHPPSA
jgi:hypothetical protein